MSEAQLRFHQSLNDLLAADLRDRWFSVPFRPGDTIKHAIEARGVPHTEIGLVMVEGAAASLSDRLRAGERVDVHPVTAGGGFSGGVARFLIDVHLGKLARDLRVLGFDTAWGPPFEDGALASRAAREGRILLTRDRALLMRGCVSAGCLVRSPHVSEQLVEVVRRFGLEEHLRPFSRCLTCNDELVDVSRDEARAHVPAMVWDLCETFRCCPTCGKVFWKGTHWDSMVRRLGPLLGSPGRGP